MPRGTFKQPTTLGALMKPQDVADHLGVCIATVWRINRDDDTFPRRFRVGKQAVYWDRAEVEAWLQQQKKNRID